ncbi:unnamed protein product [Durusdinium trenchii]|uniref:Ankyrin-1 (ANK-1) (Ankyrin-R) (Erythrocyte ankyrin) n=3 Tax=Durusdinium trenchii TaxID=1381693 RepID=A0ABP0KN47_9DINO
MSDATTRISVRWAISGELIYESEWVLADLEGDDFAAKLQWQISQTTGMCRFRQQLLVGHQCVERRRSWQSLGEPKELQLTLLRPVTGYTSELLNAVSSCSPSSVEDVLTRGQEPNVMDMYGAPAICIAGATGCLEVVQLLLEAGADLEATSLCEGTCPLFLAASNGNLEVVQCLVRAKANLNQQDHSLETPIYAAASNGYEEVVSFLAEAAADPNQADILKSTPLLVAADHGFYDVVKCLLSCKADPRIATCDGETPLYVASVEGHYEVVRALLEAGADQEISGSERSHNLLTAAQQNHIEVLQCLLQFGNAEETKKSAETLLIRAAVRGWQRWLPCLFDAGINPDATADMGFTALGIASQFGQTAVAKSLLQARADHNKRMEDGSTPLLLAAQYGRLEIASMLLQAGADIHAALDNGETAVTLAAKRGHVDVAKCLAEARQRPFANGLAKA